MRKWIVVILVLFLLTGCGTTAPEAPEAPEETTPPKTTVMLYMIGSDLEAKAGAATRDLQEIAESGVDLEHVNVVVYAGGSPHWHNESTNPENHTLLWLTGEGFQQIAAVPASSMGESACLANFLSYAYESFPADEYALILWDHGNGPVIGYGKDMLFGDDTLTLTEMQQALENTPFRENKLAWVGFDACLMASAELSYIWADFADYLVASQEVEPSFGWDYGFLSQLGQTDTVTLLQTLTSQYLQTCLDYYEDRGYDHRDTTLSCVDLSLAGQLGEAINGLFSAAAAESESNYSLVTARRVQTHGLGRATTGSEYDLIDLADLANRFADIYPAQAQQLNSVLEQMVIANAANMESCGGLSLYYPFYNKYYFEESWRESYQQLGAFPEYLTYLDDFQAVWLGNDLLEDASSATPQQDLTGTYTLQLTPQQQENFASAKYYILVRDGQEYFTRIFVSPDVTNEDGLLTAGFDGNVLYVRDEFGNYQIPVTIAHDAADGQSRYSVFVTLTNYSMNLSSVPEDFETRVQAHRFSLSLDQATGQVSVTGLVPYDHKTDTAVLTGGKLEDTVLTDWASCFFLHDDHRYLSRYENGAVMPVDQWPTSTLFSGYEYPTENGLEFVSAPLTAGDYYLLFEVEDTQGNRYCSELLPIQTTGSLPEPKPVTPIDIAWSSGEKVLLADQDGVAVSLCKLVESDGTESYLLEASNRNDHAVRVHAGDLFCNGEIFCDAYFGSVVVPPGETAQANYGEDLGTAHELDMLPDITQLQLSLSIQNNLTGAYLMYNQPFRIALSEVSRIRPDAVSARYNSFHTPVLNMLAQTQPLLETEDARVTLLGLGGNGIDSTLRGAVCIENLSDKPLTLDPEGLVLNGVYATVSGDYGQIPPYSRTYRYFYALDYYLEHSGITSVKNLRLLLQQQGYSPLFTGNTPRTLYWCDVKLSDSGPASTFPEGQELLFEENGVRVCLRSAESSKYKTTWLLTLVNTTDRDISLRLTDVHIGGEAVAQGDSPLHISHAKVGAKQKCLAELEYYFWEDSPESVDFRFRVLDFTGESILFTGAESVTLDQP